jgi:hypothetical protein
LTCLKVELALSGVPGIRSGHGAAFFQVDPVVEEHTSNRASKSPPFQENTATGSGKGFGYIMKRAGSPEVTLQAGSWNSWIFRNALWTLSVRYPKIKLGWVVTPACSAGNSLLRRILFIIHADTRGNLLRRSVN